MMLDRRTSSSLFTLVLASSLLGGCVGEPLPNDQASGTVVHVDVDGSERGPGRVDGQHDGARDGSPGGASVLAERVGDLCIYANEIPTIPSGTTTIEGGDAVVVQVTYPDCLSDTCDVDREARCDIRREGDKLVVDAAFRFTSLDASSCSFDCGWLTATCSTPPLPKGDYEIVFAGEALSLPVPSVGEACPISVPLPEASCEDDADCIDGWCGKHLDGEPLCRPYAAEGEPCGGYMPPGMAPRCDEGLACLYDSIFSDLPGVCVPES